MPGQWDVVSTEPARPPGPWDVVETRPARSQAGGREVGVGAGSDVGAGASSRTRRPIAARVAGGNDALGQGLADAAVGAVQSLVPTAGAQRFVGPIVAALPRYQPVDATERNLEVVGRNLPNALLPGSAAARVASVAAPVIGHAAGERVAGDTGGAVGEIGGQLSTGIRLTRMRPRPPVTPEATAAAALARGGSGAVDPAAMRARQAEYAAQDIQPSLADLTDEAGRRTIRGAASRPGAGQQAARDYNQAQTNDLPGRVSRQARRIVSSDRRTPEQLTEAATAARDAQAAADYKPFEGKPVQVPQVITDMLSDSSGRSIIARARADAIENQDWMAQAELEALSRAPTGQLPRVSAGTLDRLTIAARERGAAFAQRGNRYRARGAFRRQAQLNSTLDSVPDLGPARANYAEGSRQIDAVGHGSNILTGNPDDLISAYSGMSQPQNALARASAARAIEIAAGRGKDANALRVADQLSSHGEQPLINNALLGPVDANSLGNAMRLEAGRVRNAAAINPGVGSPTYMNAATGNALNGAVEAGRAGGELLRAGHGDLTAGVALLRRLEGHVTTLSDADALNLVQHALSNDPATVNAVIAEIDRLSGTPGTGTRFVQALARIRPIGLIGASTAALQAQQAQGPQ